MSASSKATQQEREGGGAHDSRVTRLDRGIPASVDALLQRVRAAYAAGDLRNIIDACSVAIDVLFDLAQPDRALELFREARGQNVHELLPMSTRLRAGRALHARGELELAASVLASICRDGLFDDLTTHAAIAVAEVELDRGRVAFARALLCAASESRHASPEARLEAQQALARIPGGGR
jgi:hypothetical protein